MKPSTEAPARACRGHTGEAVRVGPYFIHTGGKQYGPPNMDEVDIVVDLTGSQPWDLQPHQRYLDFKLQDMAGVPDDWQQRLETEIIPLLADHTLLAFCWASHGRTGTFLASLIALLEDEAETPDPIAAVRERHCSHAVETPEQVEAIKAIRRPTIPTDRGGLMNTTQATQSPVDADWYMAGTEGTGEYKVIAKSERGRVGYRLLPGYVRIRVEPADGIDLEFFHAMLAGWKEPGFGQHRFSTTARSAEDAVRMIEKGLKTIGLNTRLKRQTKTRLWRMRIRRHFANLGNAQA